ncbi:MAG TPA: helix-turn-helix domain-containing protein [Solirubrobacteraceae bacterium]|nr:helix-turn-helix domain-containing protein [Solirubrobacteraceae bacterium]
MTDQKRTYRKKRRAELEEQTRLRITESTVQLHGTVGPARTSISAVAERAGVRRSTVYRHFPDEAALFAACSAHWMAANPPPDLAAWTTIKDLDERLATALAQLYAYYRATAPMMVNLHRDEAIMPIVERLFASFRGYLVAARDALMLGRQLRGRRRQQVQAAIGHALSFPTWYSLTQEQGLNDREAADLMRRLADRRGAQPQLERRST